MATLVHFYVMTQSWGYVYAKRLNFIDRCIFGQIVWRGGWHAHLPPPPPPPIPISIIKA